MTPVLVLDDVTFRRDGKQIVDGISLTAVMFPSSGTVHILGEQLGRVDLARLRRHIGHVNLLHRLQYSLSVPEVVLTGITASRDDRLTVYRFATTNTFDRSFGSTRTGT